MLLSLINTSFTLYKLRFKDCVIRFIFSLFVISGIFLLEYYAANLLEDRFNQTMKLTIKQINPIISYNASMTNYLIENCSHTYQDKTIDSFCAAVSNEYKPIKYLKALSKISVTLCILVYIYILLAFIFSRGRILYLFMLKLLTPLMCIPIMIYAIFFLIMEYVRT